MFLISMCGHKAFDMADIKGYFIYENPVGKDVVESFPSPKRETENTEYQVWVNTRWQNGDCGGCNHYSVGYYDNIDDAKEVLQALTSISNPYVSGKVLVSSNKVVMKSNYGENLEIVLWQKNGGEKQNE